MSIKGTPVLGGLLRAAVRTGQKRATFAWQRCYWTGTNCTKIIGARKSTYRLRQADLGLRLKVFARKRGARAVASPLTRVVLTRSAPLIAAAGDIACNIATPSSGTCHQRVVSDLIIREHPVAVLPLGDLQYECGRPEEWARGYQPTWGRIKPISYPAIGNHEYGVGCGDNEASPYFKYFAKQAGPSGAGWYSYDLGSWHLIVLNSECTYGIGAANFGGCATGSREETWLRHDLATHQNLCTLAYWHEPRFSSGLSGDAQPMADLWNDLAGAHVDVVLSGHAHDYERFDPLGATPGLPSSPTTPSFQNPSLDPNGIREIVVGTGGRDHEPFAVGPLTGEVVRNGDTFGNLLMHLGRGTYDWNFVPEPGKTFTDSGSGSCH